MKTITITPAVLATISNVADRTAIEAAGFKTLSEKDVRDLCEDTTLAELFGITKTTSAQEGTMSETTETETINGYLRLLDYEFLPRTKGDQKYAGAEIPLQKASKALLLDLIEAMATNIGEMQTTIDNQDSQRVQQAQDNAQRLVQQREKAKANLVGEAKLEALKSMGLWQQLSKAQVEWLRQDVRRWRGIVVSRANKGFKISFNLPPKARKAMVAKLQQACKSADRYLKVQSSHCYVRMG